MGDHVRHAKVLVIGGGPGGYVAAIRGGQLGLDTVLVEARQARRHLPDTRLHPVQGGHPRPPDISRRWRARRRTRALHGITLARAADARPGRDWSTWKETVVEKLNTGVAALLKRAKVRVVQGWATFSDAKTCTVETKDGESPSPPSTSSSPTARCRSSCRSCPSAAT